MRPVYEDFFLIVDGSEGSYTVEAQGRGGIRVPPLPFEYHRTDELDVELNRIREGFAPARERMELVGTLLFNALFPRKIIRAFEHASTVLDEGVNLRVKLIARPPELSHLPWELLFDPDKGVFLAARLSYPIVRFIETGIPVARLLARRPLRLLHLQPGPPDTSPVEGIASENAVRQALGAHGDVKSVRQTTPEELQDVLREQPGFHILHYHGHGKFDFHRGAGYLCLHDEDGGIHRLDGEMLATYLDGTSVRLVV
ncbi:MAG TPA: CHAT domain-containing protein, partial [bacterium]|nr:CHAT domain-containing protein [bacterium]